MASLNDPFARVQVELFAKSRGGGGGVIGDHAPQSLGISRVICERFSRAVLAFPTRPEQNFRTCGLRGGSAFVGAGRSGYATSGQRLCPWGLQLQKAKKVIVTCDFLSQINGHFQFWTMLQKVLCFHSKMTFLFLGDINQLINLLYFSEHQ